MAFETAIIITVPMVIQALSTILNIPKEKLQEYYETSQALRDYITSITSGFNTDIQNELLQVTPSTTPRFDIPWITEELKKKQDDLFKVKKEITEVQTQAHQSAQESFNDSKEKKRADFDSARHTGLVGWVTGLFDKNRYKHDQAEKDFRDRKKKESDEYTKKTAQLHQNMQNITKRPLNNNNPTYQSIQERKRNAQISQKK